MLGILHVIRRAAPVLALAILPGVSGFSEVAGAATVRNDPAASRQITRPTISKLDRTGHKRIGKASFYAKKFAGRKMADGTRMRLHADNAASKTLPLGTTAKVTNLETGKSAVVTIQDRGPHVKGRIVDLSPGTAEKIGITGENGVSKVEVAPISVPQPDGGVKPGAAVHDPAVGKGTAGVSGH
jgi:rare lipoprotein A